MLHEYVTEETKCQICGMIWGNYIIDKNNPDCYKMIKCRDCGSEWTLTKRGKC